jgi:hypothetical protein
MTTTELESRLESLEADVARLKALTSQSPAPGAWRTTIGMFDNDPEFAEVIRLGREIRKQEREGESK